MTCGITELLKNLIIGHIKLLIMIQLMDDNIAGDINNKPKNYRQRYIDLLQTIDGIVKDGFSEIEMHWDDHKSFVRLLHRLGELHAEESNHFAEIRKYRKQKSIESQKTQLQKSVKN